MTIEEIQMLSDCFLVAAGVLTVLAVVLFIRFDIRNIWGLIIRHASGHTFNQDVCVTESIQPKEKRETIVLNKIETEAPEQKTVLLESTKNTMHILQDMTCIHTDVKIR